MSVVVDANLVAALVIPLPYSEHALRWISRWIKDKEDIFAPILLEYELITILRKAVQVELLTGNGAIEAINKILAIGIQYTAPTEALHIQALNVAERLGHSKAYDAQYLALADQLRSDFWTADKRLVNAANQAGLNRVNWIGNKP